MTISQGSSCMIPYLSKTWASCCCTLPMMFKHFFSLKGKHRWNPKKEKKKRHNWKKGTSIQLTKQEPSGFKKLSNYKTPNEATEYNRQNENQVGSKKLLNYRALQIHLKDLNTPQ